MPIKIKKSTGKLKIKLKDLDNPVSVCMNTPEGAQKYKRAIIIANGAGADMRSPFIEYFHKELCLAGYLTVKFNFPYQESGKKVPDRRALLEETYLRVLEYVKKKSGLEDKDIILSGKSMGGRIASQIVSSTGVKKVFFLGYPLHAPGKKDKLRDEHLYALKSRLLFLQGTRDSLCDLKKLNLVLPKLKNAKLYIVEEGDHSLKVTRRSGLDQNQVYQNCIKEIKKFCA